ncbi:30S ribosomal protein S3P [Halogeometricum pallidum JCM 14848]|uniref:Small ribosomal subunit protein uS3 n=1 Tax=Halogeometricum pallidum JCM 14848 TaxID=1227487 RepID=M0DFN3_HALPD|nr:30S ribosomal protein S3 [Halogeometricum pallidum]ELZ33512.1 30S ribosomal protein S3P [Halogeometricum pallidum JCM 14848]
MADEHQFIENGLQRSQIDEFFADELGRAGYGGMDVAKTPMGTQIVLKAEKPGMVIGKGGKNIRKVTKELENRFDLDDPQIDVQEVDEPDLNARIVADRLANALERGWYFRKAGHTTIDRIMDAGALGAEIILAGKVTGARSRVEKFNRGYIKHNGEPAQSIVDEGQGVAVMKLGTIGVNVKIIPPGAKLPDDFEIEDDADPEAVEQTVESEGVEELLEDEPEEIPDVTEDDEDVDVPDEDPTEVIDEEIVEEVVEESGDVASRSESAEPDPQEEPVGTGDVEDEDVSPDDDEADATEAELDEEVEAEAEDLVSEMEEADEDEANADDADEESEADAADEETEE